MLMAAVLCVHGAKTIAFGNGRITVTSVARNAVRVQYANTDAKSDLPDWVYVKHEEVTSTDVKVDLDPRRQLLTIRDHSGRVVFRATSHKLSGSEATLVFDSPKDESLFGLGQFQDGFSNVRGLSRRLTQVNTQISLPMLLSSKGYGVLWNNYGMTEFNPCGRSMPMTLQKDGGVREEVNVTTTEGGKKEVRERNVFEATIDVKEDGDYTLLLDVGQKMARRHNLSIDGTNVINMNNLWLPPTASTIVHLKAGRHKLTAELTKEDKPTVYYNKVGNTTVFRSPVAEAVDYTVFVGSPDEIIATYRDLTGHAPQMPSWALGYIHCRERFHSSQEILETANRFREEKMPLDVIVQDWQYWGKYGWNSMRFDEQYYPDPKALTDSLHRMGVKLMVSVWSKIDKNSDVGRQMAADDYYIPGTDWIDFFNPDAAAAYWRNFSERLVPLGIDAWWQDATEPENDDLAGRRVNRGKWSGEQVRNVYPLLVNKTVYEGLQTYNTKHQASATPLILTRCGFPGIQRYGAALWSGDVGNDWETFRRQIVAGLGVQAAGIPWWTYDAGGFFRPGDQYTNKEYIERMLRWIETSVYLPLMRVHGYMSNTEPWNYGPEAQAIIAECLHEREQLRPYLDECARRVATEGYTLMRPLVFDFADDPVALQQKYEYMFGPDLLISPVTEPGVTEWKTYLPRCKGGWRDYHTGRFYEGGQTVTTPVTLAYIPVFVRATAAATSKVYDKENTGANYPVPVMPAASALPVIRQLPNALEGVNSFADWERRRNDIGHMIQHYGIGRKPAVDDGQVTATMKGDTLIVYVTVGQHTIKLHSAINYPKVGKPPYALMIGTSMISLPKDLFDNRPIATLIFHEKQVNDYGQWGRHHDRGQHPFDSLYPDLTANGAYSEWAWGLSRILDGLQQLGPDRTKIDISHIGVTGCSYAGKMALYCGAFDERIALTIAQEPGGGGAAAWRASHESEEKVEDIDKTDYHWFLESQKRDFSGDDVYRLPYDQHELCAMVCPRALLLLGNPDYPWLSDPAMLVSAKAAHHVWQRFGIADRMAWDIVGGHGHCQLPDSQRPIVQSFIDRFLLGKE
ncbi:MAG: hypothetical protein IJP74_02300 [Prevotella sp.]|nr:hypothetical protein [Prevotella sp.]